MYSAFAYTVRNAKFANQTEEEELKKARAETKAENADAKKADGDATEDKGKAVLTLMA